MITITRRQARRLRGVFRRSVLGISHRGIIAPLVLRAEGTQLRAHYRYSATLAVEHVEPGSYPPGETIALPLDALAEFESRAESPVMLVAVAPERTQIRWEDRGIPQSREYDVPTLETLGAFPEPPHSWKDMPAELLDALLEASRTTTDDNTRYALNCIQLAGTTHEVAATDGRQLLVSRGFSFPWTTDVLIRSSPLFASKALPRDQPISIGKSDTHVVLRAGPWTFFLEIQSDVRFPSIDRVIPDSGATVTRLRLDAHDVAFLGQALDRLPGAEELNSPLTVECNGRVVVRARNSDQTQVTDLVLSRSRYTGSPVRLNTNRELLSRALRLGFAEIEVIDAETPVVCRTESRVFAWQPLSKEGVIEPADDVIRIESDSQTTPAAIPHDAPPRRRTTVNEHTPTNRENAPARDKPRSDGVTNGPGAPENPGPPGLAALIQEAEAVHDALGAARARTGRLVVALRRYRRRERLVQSTLASLRQLKLSEVAG